jgi:hypothetical protein
LIGVGHALAVMASSNTSTETENAANDAVRHTPLTTIVRFAKFAGQNSAELMWTRGVELTNHADKHMPG